MLIITDYKSGEFYLKKYYIEYTSAKIKYCPIEFDIDSIQKDTNCIYCTPLKLPNATNKDIIMCQLKPFKQHVI